jgi:hypothetical protein
MSRGRPSEQAIKLTKYTQKCIEVPSKPELGWQSIWHFDDDKNKNGAWRVEHIPPKGYKHPKHKIDQRLYNKNQPTVVVFKTSNRSNAKVKMKVINKNVDYVLTAKKIPGIPDIAEWLEVGVGKSFIESYKLKYNL